LATRVRDFVFLPALLLVGYEELFDLRQKSFAHIRDSVKALVLVGMDRSPEKPAILVFAILCLLGVMTPISARRSDIRRERARPSAP
jgi:hypothetical protein